MWNCSLYALQSIKFLIFSNNSSVSSCLLVASQSRMIILLYYSTEMWENKCNVYFQTLNCVTWNVKNLKLQGLYNLRCGASSTCWNQDENQPGTGKFLWKKKKKSSKQISNFFRKRNSDFLTAKCHLTLKLFIYLWH